MTKDHEPAPSRIEDKLTGKSLRGRMRRSGEKRQQPPLRNLLPNVLTVLALCAGLTAIRFGLEGRYEFAVYAILVAALLDALDGRLARMLKAQSSFGAELDSLADFFNFGVAPVLILYTWSLDTLGGLGWVAVLGYSVACALRLARFNVASEDPDRPSWANAFFVGVPAPAAAGLVMLPLYMDFTQFTTFNTWPSLVAFHIGIVAFLMVSRLPTFSGKHLRLSTRRDKALPFLLGVALVAALAVSYPWMTVIGITALYAVSLPLAFWRHRVLEKRTQIARASRDRSLDEESGD